MITFALMFPALAQDAPAVPEVPGIPEVPAAPDVPQPPSVPLRPSYFADQAVTVDAPTGDLFAFAQRLDIPNPVADNVFSLSESLHVTGPVGGDLYGMGSSIVIDAPVAGDVYAMGATVEITSKGSVDGNLTVGSGALEVHGPIGGNLHVNAGRVVLASRVAGDAFVRAETIDARDELSIAGDLAYVAPTEDPGLAARTAGETTFTKELAEVEIDLEPEPEPTSFVWSATWWGGMTLWGYLTKLMVGSVMFVLGGAAVTRIGHELSRRPGASVGVGFVVSALLPLLSTLAIVTVLPFPLGILGWMATAVALYIGQLFAAQAVGDWLLRRFQPQAVGSPYISLAVGLVPLMLVFALPWIGNLAWLMATFAGIGAVGLRLRDRP